MFGLLDNFLNSNLTILLYIVHFINDDMCAFWQAKPTYNAKKIPAFTKVRTGAL
jgi:hypothetical protein